MKKLPKLTILMIILLTGFVMSTSAIVDQKIITDYDPSIGDTHLNPEKGVNGITDVDEGKTSSNGITMMNENTKQSETSIQPSSLVDVVIRPNLHHYVLSPATVGPGDTLFWSFSFGSNVKLTVYLMDSGNYTNFILSQTYQSITLSSGVNLNSGSYAIPTSNLWYVVFYHNDATTTNFYNGQVGAMFTSDSEPTPYLKSASFQTIDTDGDVQFDAVTVDYVVGINSGTCDLESNFVLFSLPSYANYYNELILNTSITGSNNNFGFSFDPVFMTGDYQIALTVKCQGSTVYDSWATTTISLTSTTATPTPYIRYLTYYSVDSDSDSYFDTLTLNYDIDIAIGTADLVIIADLYDSADALVETKTQNINITGADYDSFLLSFSAVNVFSIHYVDFQVYSVSPLTLQDSQMISGLELGPGTSSATAYFASISLVRLDGNSDGNFEKAGIVFDLDLSAGSGSVHVAMDLYDSNSNYIEHKASNFTITGQAVDSFSLTFSPVAVNNSYYINAYVYFSDEFTADDSWLSDTFVIGPDPVRPPPSSSNPPSSNPRSDPSSNPTPMSNSTNSPVNSDTGDIGGLPFTNTLMIFIYIGFAAMFRTYKKQKNNI